MFYIIGILAIIGIIAFIGYLFMKAYNQDQKEQDERTLVLEKRINEILKNLTWRIDMQSQIRGDFEEQVNAEILKLRKQVKKNKEV